MTDFNYLDPSSNVTDDELPTTSKAAMSGYQNYIAKLKKGDEGEEEKAKGVLHLLPSTSTTEEGEIVDKTVFTATDVIEKSPKSFADEETPADECGEFKEPKLNNFSNSAVRAIDDETGRFFSFFFFNKRHCMG